MSWNNALANSILMKNPSQAMEEGVWNSLYSFDESSGLAFYEEFNRFVTDLIALFK